MRRRSDADEPAKADDIAFMTGYNVAPVVAARSSLKAAIDRHYGSGRPPDPDGMRAAPAEGDLATELRWPPPLVPRAIAGTSITVPVPRGVSVRPPPEEDVTAFGDLALDPLAVAACRSPAGSTGRLPGVPLPERVGEPDVGDGGRAVVGPARGRDDAGHSRPLGRAAVDHRRRSGLPAGQALKVPCRALTVTSFCGVFTSRTRRMRY